MGRGASNSNVRVHFVAEAAKAFGDSRSPPKLLASSATLASALARLVKQSTRCDQNARDVVGKVSNGRMSLVQLVAGPLWRFLNAVDDGDFYLQSIAVTPRCRGEGIGSLLIDAIEERAANTNATRIVLDVAAKNEGARRLYERRGMTDEKSWPRRFPIPQFRVLRMAKPLS